MITQKELHKLLRYNHETGDFIYIASMKRIKVGDTAGRLHSMGYWCIGLFGEQYLAHRLAWLYVHGEFPENQIDHINHDRIDNRIVNLREATNATNHMNRPMQRNNKSGFTGVFFEKSISKWRAQLRTDGKNIHLGVFHKLSDAIKARKKGNIRHGFHENHGATKDC